MLTPVHVHNLLIDISDLIDIKSAKEDSTQSINSQDSLKIHVIKAWHPVNHNYLILQVQLSPLAQGKGWTQIAVIDSGDIENINSYDNGELKRLADEDINNVLFQDNLNHKQNYDYVFVSDKIPSISKIIEKRKTLVHQLNLVISTQLIPFLKDDLFSEEYDAIAAKSKEFYINLAQVKPNFVSFALEDQGWSSDLQIDVELIDPQKKPMGITKHISIPISYFDYSDVYWIYENDPKFQEVKSALTNIQPVIDEVIKKISDKKIKYTYEDLSFYLGKFYNFADSNKFLLNDNHKGDVTGTFTKLVSMGIYSGLVKSVDQSKTSNQILQIKLLSNINRSGEVTLLMGPGGMTLDEKVIYNPRSSIHNSLQNARNLINLQVKEDVLKPKVQMLVAVFDGRQSTNTIIEKAKLIEHKDSKQKQLEGSNA